MMSQWFFVGNIFISFLSQLFRLNMKHEQALIWLISVIIRRQMLIILFFNYISHCLSETESERERERGSRTKKSSINHHQSNLMDHEVRKLFFFFSFMIFYAPIHLCCSFTLSIVSFLFGERKQIFL